MKSNSSSRWEKIDWRHWRNTLVCDNFGSGCCCCRCGVRVWLKIAVEMIAYGSPWPFVIRLRQDVSNKFIYGKNDERPLPNNRNKLFQHDESGSGPIPAYNNNNEWSPAINCGKAQKPQNLIDELIRCVRARACVCLPFYMRMWMEIIGSFRTGKAIYVFQ